ncbi:MAG: YceI family protein [Candidatus Korobacteraceae bacterium]
MPENIDVRSSGDSHTPGEISASSGVSYGLDSRVSRFIVRAFASGVLSAFGHSPTIALRDFEGEARVNPDHMESSSLRLILKAASLTVTDDISDKDRRELEREMQEKVLETAKYPEIVYDCTQVSVDSSENGNNSVKLLGSLTLHGVTRRQPVQARLALSGDMLRAFGEFAVRQSDYNIKPVSAIGGGLKVKDEVKFSFDIVGRKK